jgi:hypothetical protein
VLYETNQPAQDFNPKVPVSVELNGISHRLYYRGIVPGTLCGPAYWTSSNTVPPTTERGRVTCSKCRAIESGSKRIPNRARTGLGLKRKRLGWNTPFVAARKSGATDLSPQPQSRVSRFRIGWWGSRIGPSSLKFEEPVATTEKLPHERVSGCEILEGERVVAIRPFARVKKRANFVVFDADDELVSPEPVAYVKK